MHLTPSKANVIKVKPREGDTTDLKGEHFVLSPLHGMAVEQYLENPNMMDEWDLIKSLDYSSDENDEEEANENTKLKTK